MKKKPTETQRRCLLAIAKFIYAFGAKPDESDIEEAPDGEWVKWEDADARVAEHESEVAALRAQLAASNALLREGMPLLGQWRTTDITADDDTWADFTNDMHRWHDRMRAHLSDQASERIEES